MRINTSNQRNVNQLNLFSLFYFFLLSICLVQSNLITYHYYHIYIKEHSTQSLVKYIIEQTVFCQSDRNRQHLLMMIIDWLDLFVILFCELKVEWFSQTKKMMMMRRVLMFVICWTFSHGSLPKNDDLDLVNVRATPNLHDYNLHRWVCYVPLFGSCDKTIVKLTLYTEWSTWILSICLLNIFFVSRNFLIILFSVYRKDIGDLSHILKKLDLIR